jgi:uncharacterized membrane protein
VKIRGHPIHPVVAIFPMALLAASAASDLMAWTEHRAAYSAAARFALGAGVIAGVIVAIPGITDALAYPRGARGTATRHGILNGAALVAMSAGWWLRRGAAGASPSPLAYALTAVAVTVTFIAWRTGVRLTPAPASDRGPLR